jgi:signal peptidase I
MDTDELNNAPQGRLDLASEDEPNINGPPKPDPTALPPPSVLRELGSLGIKIAVIVGIVVLAFSFVFGLHYSKDLTMDPAVKDGDWLIYSRLDKDYHAGDLILLSFQGDKEVRRVIATAGDTVDITVQGLIINGALRQEENIHQKTEQYLEGIEFPLTLREGEVFVLGDAREGVADSRIYGAVDVKDTSGLVVALFRRRGL